MKEYVRRQADELQAWKECRKRGLAEVEAGRRDNLKPARPKRIEAMQLPEESSGETPTKWFEKENKALFEQAYHISRTFSGYGDIEKQGSASLWVDSGCSKPFRWLVKEAARQDNLCRGWQRLLESKLHRTYLGERYAGQGLGAVGV